LVTHILATSSDLIPRVPSSSLQSEVDQADRTTDY
jgi:hypothetical protein